MKQKRIKSVPRKVEKLLALILLVDIFSLLTYLVLNFKAGNF